MSQRHRNKDKKRNQMKVPEIFKDLWGFDFIENIGFARIKGETPKIRIVVAIENENKVALIKNLLLKYEFPFSNLKVDYSGDKKESETKTTESGHSLMSRMNKPAGKENGKLNIAKILGRRKLPPFKCI